MPSLRRILVVLAALVGTFIGTLLATATGAPLTVPAGAQVGPTSTTTTTDPASTTTTTTAPPAAPPAAPAAEPTAPSAPAGPTAEQILAFYRLMAGPPVPDDSGTGRRIVYSNSAQRVWLVEENGAVARTYLVSGRSGLPRLGTYSVFGRSRFTTSGSVRMEYMVRFARGRNLAIGFHTIPVRANGTPLQSAAELGRPRSHGCVRQAPADAMYLWMWAPMGTNVVAVR